MTLGVSEYAAKNIMKEDNRISAEIAKNPNSFDDTIPALLIDTIEGSDATLTAIERMRTVDPQAMERMDRG